jgi:hypothetical protein
MFSIIDVDSEAIPTAFSLFNGGTLSTGGAAGGCAGVFRLRPRLGRRRI